MKTKILIPAIYFVCFYAFSQAPAFPTDPDTKKIAYSEVIELGKGVKKGTITTRIQNWSKTKKYLSKNKQASGTFATKGSVTVVYPGATAGKSERGSVEFICTSYIKDGRYKYVISNFKHSGEAGRASGGALELEVPECGKYVMPPASWGKIKQQTFDAMPKIVASLKDAAAGKQTVVKKKNPADF